ncbi:MAG: PhzF family phenazine biosynthesis protein [Alphaproteobacteria bacterium]|nr:PhzF family phenazine biosynthesis protein [Alphaproteobacteria bacterium]
MALPIYHIDAFASAPFTGNPASVCPLERWLPDHLMQQIAAENNLSATAFFVPEPAGAAADYALRWFTPAVEVDLCGHATLASADVVLGDLRPAAQRVRFSTKSGILTVERAGGLLALDFPARPPKPCAAPAGLAAALGAAPVEVHAARDLMCVFSSEETVRALRPDMVAVARLDTFAVIATAAGRDVDFVSRFFAPAKGVPEDPVTGSAHCTLIPYWAERLGKTSLSARQVSARGGDLACALHGERVRIAGRAIRYMSGTFHV